MSRVPLLYFSRGQLESLDWPDAVVDVAAPISKDEAKSATVRIRHWRIEVLNNLIANSSVRSLMMAPSARLAIGL
jgi:hypothetical protein